MFCYLSKGEVCVLCQHNDPLTKTRNIFVSRLYRCWLCCRLYVNYRFMRGIEQQFLALQKGFTEIVPAQLLRPFDERELELIIGGLGSIDIEDWKANTRLKVCSLVLIDSCCIYNVIRKAQVE